MEGAIRVLLVEDNDVYRDALEFLLDRYEDVEVVGGVAMGGAARDACLELGADVVVVDYRLPDIDGSEVAAELRERCSETAVVFLSASAGPDEVAAAQSSGVALVGKDEGVDALVDAIRAAAGRMRA
ncbi:MAG: response regulator transcription factor [Actinomycetota bacterium]|nr:response regulator transcription factor [Actinomycetota bacterium]